MNDREKRLIERCSNLDDEEQYGLHEGQTQKDVCIEGGHLISPAGYLLTYFIGLVGFLFSLPFIIFVLKRIYRVFRKTNS